MEFKGSNLIKLLLMTQCLTVLYASEDFDFFYFVEQWPGSYCDLKKACCYPTSGKPAADFGIHGLWPNRKDGSYPSNCDPNSPFNPSQISSITSTLQSDWPTLACPSNDGLKFWAHEWEKHGTCSESKLKQLAYFESALKLKQKANLKQTLRNAGINPDGKSYTLSNIEGAIKKAVGFTPHIDCNVDASGNNQLYQVYMCVNAAGSNFIECPVFPKGSKCKPSIVFPAF
ncbi:hypothetical protein TanjilG_06728 [Lupinus angustifolius]|uniref:Uncharacterized protein n=1 Tax=Lupinus angustifolius TaxID=3871 RepID=A0A1J7HK65_LUPAN|nr:PREDICTED: extracellular ribonuclease LE-like [Lupinus angustifolius]OIW02133.1 hypothetical protein TanjilG_06728 [Lupinus angustifolius]